MGVSRYNSPGSSFTGRSDYQSELQTLGSFLRDGTPFGPARKPRSSGGSVDLGSHLALDLRLNTAAQGEYSQCWVGQDVRAMQSMQDDDAAETQPIMPAALITAARMAERDKRTRRERRAGRKLAAQATQMYGRTYVITERQLALCLAITCVSIIALSVALTKFTLFLVNGPFGVFLR